MVDARHRHGIYAIYILNVLQQQQKESPQLAKWRLLKKTNMHTLTRTEPLGRANKGERKKQNKRKKRGEA